MKAPFLGKRSSGRVRPDENRVRARDICKSGDCPCFYCENKMFWSRSDWEQNTDNLATVEHLIPISEGGTNDPENLRVACSLCNNLRQSKKFEWFRYFISKLKRNKKLMKRWHNLSQEERSRIFKRCDREYDAWLRAIESRKQAP